MEKTSELIEKLNANINELTDKLFVKIPEAHNAIISTKDLCDEVRRIGERLEELYIDVLDLIDDDDVERKYESILRFLEQVDY